MAWTEIAELVVDPMRGRVYETGWQSWSPAGTYPVGATSPRPQRDVWQTMAFRPDRPGPVGGFQSEGLLVVDPGDGGPVHGFCGLSPDRVVPSIRAALTGHVVRVTSDRELATWVSPGPISRAVAGWAEQLGSHLGAGPFRPVPPVWCSWYCYWRSVTADVVWDNAVDAARAGIDLGVVQIDDGWQPAIGDWHAPSPRFGDLARLVGRLRDRDLAVGIWLAPHLVGDDSELAHEHPDWLLPHVDAGFNWGSRLRVLDLAHPAARENLGQSLRWLKGLGITYFKLDFLYAGAIPDSRRDPTGAVADYRDGLTFIRECVGPESTILGCGAPLLPSVGLVDAMRVSPDIMPSWEPPDGDVSQPGGRAAVLAGRGRQTWHGRLWHNDPDCLLARPGVERRADWAAHLRAVGGLASASDAVRDLDAWGLTVTRELMRPSDPAPASPLDW
ncbi:MAG TPA: glycoside hydrolase family 36 protein [Mycobacteriales bacterium]